MRMYALVRDMAVNKKLARRQSQFQTNLAFARRIWPGQLGNRQKNSLRILTYHHAVCLPAGDVQLLEGSWYVTHSGLLRLSQRKGCQGIRVQPLREYCDAATGRWVFRATVYTRSHSKGFVGFGDADPTNVSPRVHGAEMRVAETRAVNRALRKAYGIGICSVEELGSLPPATCSPGEPTPAINPHQPANGSNNGQPRLRDQLCQLIRHYNLNPTLVKAYAADFCGTQKLSEASRDRVEAFIRQLAKSAKENRDALQCRLNAYARPQEVTT